MIKRLHGNIVDISPKYVVVDVGGVGYEVYVGTNAASVLHIGHDTTLHIHTVVREDSIELFGFETKEELEFFSMLIGVSGVGPKSALLIVSGEPIESLAKAIANGDSSYLTKFSGVGKKTAEKIVVELRDKLTKFVEHTYEKSDDAYGDVALALESLGYEAREIREVLRQMQGKKEDAGSTIKEAIKRLSKGK